MSNRQSRFAEALTPPRVSNPILSAVQFASNTREDGGATMNVTTNKVASPGDPINFVGAEPDPRTGTKIPTQTVQSLTPADVLHHKARIAAVSQNNPRMNIGSWKNRDGSVDIDASGGYDSQTHAKDLVISRNEDAGWDMKNMRNFNNEGIRKRRKMGPRPPREG